jgi:SSS family solute:Na+ symporter
MHDVIAALTVGYDLLVGAIFVPILAAIIADRGSPMAALISIVTSATVVVILIWVYGIDSVVPIYGGLAASTITFLIGSAMIPFRADWRHSRLE